MSGEATIPTTDRVRCVRISASDFASLSPKDDSTMYFVSETGSFDPQSMDDSGVLYLGDKIINIDQLKGQGYGTCSTSSGTLMDVTMSGYEIHTNCFVAVNFQNAVPASATMRINSSESSDAKPIYNNGSAITANVIKAGRKALFLYDGTCYNLIVVENDGDNVKPDWEAASGTDAEILNIPQIKRGGASGTPATAIKEGNVSSNTAVGQYSHAEGNTTYALAESSHAEGLDTYALGDRSHAEGRGSRTTMSITGSGTSYTSSTSVVVGDVIKKGNTFVRVTAVGSGGSFTVNNTLGTISSATNVEKIKGCAYSGQSHVEGQYNNATGGSSHAEGYNNYAVGAYSHAEGTGCRATGNSAHAEGNSTTATGDYSHAEGYMSTVGAAHSHSEGRETVVGGPYSHAEGYLTYISGSYSHSENSGTMVTGLNSHSEGVGTYSPNATAAATFKVSGSNPYTSATAHGLSLGMVVRISGVAGWSYVTEVADSTHFTTKEALGTGTLSNATCVRTLSRIIIATGSGTTYTTSFAHNLKIGNVVSYENTYRVVTAVANTTSFTVNDTLGSLSSSEVFLQMGITYGSNSHSEGYANTVSGSSAHGEGRENIAYGTYSHSEGYNTQGRATGSHTEGYGTISTGIYSHAEGYSAVSRGAYSHAEGAYTETTNDFEHAEGRYNKSNSAGTDATRTRHSIGIGTGSGTNKKNAFEVMANGDAYLYGVGDYDGKNAVEDETLTLQDVINGHGTEINELHQGVEYYDRVHVGANGLLQNSLCAFNKEEELVSLVFLNPKDVTQIVPNTTDRFPYGAKIYYYTGTTVAQNVSGTDVNGVTLYSSCKHADMRKMLFGATDALKKAYIGKVQSGGGTSYVDQSALYLSVDASDRYGWCVKTVNNEILVPYTSLAYDEVVIRLGCHNATATTDTDWYSMNLEDNNPMYVFCEDDQEDPALMEYNLYKLYDMVGDVESLLEAI
jgi:hypothetical protein